MNKHISKNRSRLRRGRISSSLSLCRRCKRKTRFSKRKSERYRLIWTWASKSRYRCQVWWYLLFSSLRWHSSRLLHHSKLMLLLRRTHKIKMDKSVLLQKNKAWMEGNKSNNIRLLAIKRSEKIGPSRKAGVATMTWWRSWKTIRKSFRRNIQTMRLLTSKVGRISHVTPCWPRTSYWWESRCSAGISSAQLLRVLTAFQEVCRLATAFWRTIQSSWCRLEGQTKRSSVTWRSTTTSCAPTATRRFWGCARS